MFAKNFVLVVKLNTCNTVSFNLRVAPKIRSFPVPEKLAESGSSLFY